MSKRRQRGEGGISPYEIKAGTRWLIKYQVPDQAHPGRSKAKLVRGFTSAAKAGKALRQALAELDRGMHVEPSKRAFGAYLDEWLDGLRLADSTVSSYRRCVRLHVKPHIGHVPLRAVTSSILTALYKQLETNGRKDGRAGGLSARTVRYIHTILHKALADAARDGLVVLNPAVHALPPTAKQAKAPEMRTWDEAQLGAFLRWSSDQQDELHVAWLTLAMTGARRGEVLGLRWQDVDLEGATVAFRRSVGVVKEYGAGERIVVGSTKTYRARVVDLDPHTVAQLRAHRLARAGLSLAFAHADAPVFGDSSGHLRHPERFGREWRRRLARAQADLGGEAVPSIRLHDLRHAHATIMLKRNQPVKVVSERLGHASPMITLSVYQHVMPGMQRDAANEFAAAVLGDVSITGVSDGSP